MNSVSSRKPAHRRDRREPEMLHRCSRRRPRASTRTASPLGVWSTFPPAAGRSTL